MKVVKFDKTLPTLDYDGKRQSASKVAEQRGFDADQPRDQPREQRSGWITIKGAHVFLNDDGVIEKGPAEFKGKRVEDITQTVHEKWLASLTPAQKSEMHALAKSWVYENQGEIKAKAISDINHGKENLMVTAIKNGAPLQQTLYRGMSLPLRAEGTKNFIASMQEGKSFNIGPSSFSSSRSIAEGFAYERGAGNRLQVMISTEENTKGFKINEFCPKNMGEKETVTAGVFLVTHAELTNESAGHYLKLTVKQTGIFG